MARSTSSKTKVSDVESAIYDALKSVGAFNDPDAKALDITSTPARVARAWVTELLRGYSVTDDDLISQVRLFDAGGNNELVVQTGISFTSLCAHHMLPFHGTATIGYLPGGKLIGLSKLARILDHYAARLQVQERLGAQVATFIRDRCDAQYAVVLLHAEHQCYDGKTEVLTPEGWVRFDELKTDGGLVAQVDPTTQLMSFVRPTSYVQSPYSGPMYEWDNDVASLCVTPQHRMLFQTEWSWRQQPYRWTFDEAQNMRSRFYVPQAVRWIGEEVETLRLGDHDIDADDWLRFMGVFVAEGCTRETGRNVTLSQNVGSFENEMWALCQRLPMKFRRGLQRKETHSHIISVDPALYDQLREYGKSGDKFVPDVVKTLSPRQIQIFLDWYSAGDGHNPGRDAHRTHYVSKSRRLIDDVQELEVRLGRTGAVQQYEACARMETRTHGVQDVTRKDYGTFAPKDLHIDQFSGIVYCVNVPTGALLVRRNGRTIVSGNCMTCRGVRRPGTVTTTSSIRPIRVDRELLNEFYLLAGQAPTRR